MSLELEGVAPGGTVASPAVSARRGSSVTEWVMTEVLRHSTVWPAWIVTVAGVKLEKPMSTVAAAWGEGASWAGPPRPQPASARVVRAARAGEVGMRMRRG